MEFQLPVRGSGTAEVGGQRLEPLRRIGRVDDADAFVPGGQARAEVGGEEPVPAAVAPVERAHMTARQQADLVDSAGYRSGHPPAPPRERDSRMICRTPDSRLPPAG